MLAVPIGYSIHNLCVPLERFVDSYENFIFSDMWVNTFVGQSNTTFSYR